MKDYLLDSNIVIYAGKTEFAWLIPDFIHDKSSVSLITKIEVLGFHNFQGNQLAIVEPLFENLTIFDISPQIATLAIFLRQHKKMSLGDSIIASTALLEDKTLVTRNISDFSWITDLQLLNPID